MANKTKKPQTSQYKFDRSCKSCHVRWGQSGDAMHARLQLTWDSPGGSSFLYLLCPDTQTSAQPDRKKESVRACGSCTAYISAALHTAGYCARSKRILWDVYGAVMAVMQHHYAIHDNGNMLDPKYVYRTKVLLCFLKLRTNLLFWWNFKERCMKGKKGLSPIFVILKLRNTIQSLRPAMSFLNTCYFRILVVLSDSSLYLPYLP